MSKEALACIMNQWGQRKNKIILPIKERKLLGVASIKALFGQTLVKWRNPL
jgi:hypothetical protein